MMAFPGVPGVAQGAIQSARFAADTVRARLAGRTPKRTEFSYFDKGSMATIARFKAVVQMGKVSLTGFTAWVSWCFLHLLYIVGFKSQVGTLVNWFFSFLSGARSQRTTTNQQLVARLAMEQLGSGVSGKLVAGEDVVEELVHSAQDEHSEPEVHN